MLKSARNSIDLFWVKWFFTLLLLSLFLVPEPVQATTQAESQRFRILIVSSYHREYLWSQSTHAGVMAAMLRYGFWKTNNR